MDVAPIGKFRYQASIRVNDSHICSGSILDDFNVLTSAKCVVRYVEYSEFFNFFIQYTLFLECKNLKVLNKQYEMCTYSISKLPADIISK